MSEYAKQADAAKKIASIVGSVNHHKQFSVAVVLICQFWKYCDDEVLREYVNDSYKNALFRMPSTPRVTHELAKPWLCKTPLRNRGVGAAYGACWSTPTQ